MTCSQWVQYLLHLAGKGHSHIPKGKKHVPQEFQGAVVKQNTYNCGVILFSAAEQIGEIVEVCANPGLPNCAEKGGAVRRFPVF